MNSIKASLRHIIGILLALTLILSAFGAQAESPDEAAEAELLALSAKIDELVAEIYEIIAEGSSFEYKGVTYTKDEGVTYANTELFGTDDYYPFFDALRDAAVLQSTRIGELFLQEVDAYNEYARLLGYDGYIGYAAQRYGYDESTPKIIDAILTLYPRSMQSVLNSSYLRTGIDGLYFVEHEEFMREVAAWYGEMDPAYQKSLEELILSDRFTSSRAPYALSGGYVRTFADASMLPLMHIDYSDDAIFTKTAVHECGHYIHDAHEIGKHDEGRLLSVIETHSIGGELLLHNKLSDFYIQMTDESMGNFLSLYALYQQLLLFPGGVAEYLLLTDLFAHPESYTPSSIAERYLQISFDMGFDAGFSPDYQILSGVEWINIKNLFDNPLYDPAYSIATLNALWLWREQEVNGDGIERYVKLVNTPVADMPYAEYCVYAGLPDFTDAAAHAGLDDFLADKLEALETLVYGAEE